MVSKIQNQAIEDFWRWFSEAKSSFELLAETEDPLWDFALGKLKTIDEGLWFELSDLDVTPREFIITAEGISELFPLVEEIVQKSPKDPNWKFVALKPPLGFDFVTEYEGIQVDPKDLWFLPLDSGTISSVLELRIGVRSYEPEKQEAVSSATLLILDTALGERIASQEIHVVEVCALPASPEKEGYFALPELPAYLAWRKRELFEL